MKIRDLPKTEEAVRFFQEKSVLAEILTCDKNHEMKLLMEMKFNGTATFDLIAVREVSVKTHGFSHQN